MATLKKKNIIAVILIGGVLYLGYLADILTVLNSIPDGILSKMFKWLILQLKYPPLITRVIFFFAVIIALVHLVVNVQKRQGSATSYVGYRQVSILILDVVAILLLGVVLIKNDAGGGPDISKNIGIVYDSRSVNQQNIKEPATEVFEAVSGRLDVHADLRFLDIRRSSNQILSIDKFVRSNNIRYLILAGELSTEHAKTLINRGKNRFMLIKNTPFDSSDIDRSKIIAMYISANQEAATIIKSLVQSSLNEVLLIHPTISTMTDYENEFVQSFKTKAIPYNVIVREFSLVELNKAEEFIQKFFLDNSSKQTRGPPIILVGSATGDAKFDQFLKLIGPTIYLSSKIANPTVVDTLPASKVAIPLPWPTADKDFLPFVSTLVSSTVEMVIELEHATTDETRGKIEIAQLRKKLFELYSSFENKYTQSVLGATSLNANNYPHLIVENMDMCYIYKSKGNKNDK